MTKQMLVLRRTEEKQGPYQRFLSWLFSSFWSIWMQWVGPNDMTVKSSVNFHPINDVPRA